MNERPRYTISTPVVSSGMLLQYVFSRVYMLLHKPLKHHQQLLGLWAGLTQPSSTRWTPQHTAAAAAAATAAAIAAAAAAAAAAEVAADPWDVARHTMHTLTAAAAAEVAGDTL